MVILSMMKGFINKEEILKNYFFPECDKATKKSNKDKKMFKLGNHSPEGKKSGGFSEMLKAKGMENFYNCLIEDVIQSFLKLSKNLDTFSAITMNLEVNNGNNLEISETYTNYMKENQKKNDNTSNLFNKDGSSKGLNLENQNILEAIKREDSSSSMKEDYMRVTEPGKKNHTLSGISLINKIYFLVLLFREKFDTSFKSTNNLKNVDITNVFQNYYPQDYDKT